MTTAKRRCEQNRTVLESRLAYHLRCLREDATDPEITTLDRLGLVRDRTIRIREIRQGIEPGNQRTERLREGDQDELASGMERPVMWRDNP